MEGVAPHIVVTVPSLLPTNFLVMLPTGDSKKAGEWLQRLAKMAQEKL